MGVRSEKLGTFHADGPIAKRRAFGGAGDDADMLWHEVGFRRDEASVRSLLRCLICAISLTAIAAYCGVGNAQTAARSPMVFAPTLDATTVITLERGPCIGRCSEYALSINGLGEVVFEGRRLVCARGRHTATAPRDEVRRLLLQMLEMGYFEVQWPAGPITTEQPVVKSSLRYEGRVREIEHDLGDANAPLWLKRLEERIDAIAGVSRWLPDREEADRRPMCNKEGGFRLPLEES